MSLLPASPAVAIGDRNRRFGLSALMVRSILDLTGAAMPRIRTIQPSFPRSGSMSRVSHEARLLFVLLWLVADDAGRARAAPEELAPRLYPSEPEMLPFLPAWLDELEREGCIERYTVDEVVHLRVVNWRRHQRIDRPTRSRLPAPPREPRPAREDSRAAREEAAESPAASRPEAGAREDFDFVDGAREFTAERVRRDLDRLQRAAEADRSHTAAIRATEMIGRSIGLLGGGKEGAARRQGRAEGRGQGQNHDKADAPRSPPLSETVRRPALQPPPPERDGDGA